MTAAIISGTIFLQEALFGNSLSSFSTLYLWSSNLVLGLLFGATLLTLVGPRALFLGLLGLLFLVRNRHLFEIYIEFGCIKLRHNPNTARRPKAPPANSKKQRRPGKSSTLRDSGSSSRVTKARGAPSESGRGQPGFWAEAARAGEALVGLWRRANTERRRALRLCLYGRSKSKGTCKKIIFLFENERFYLTTWSKPIGLDRKRYTDSLNQEIRDLQWGLTPG